MQKLPHTEVLRLSGKAGQHLSAVRAPYCHFRVESIHATDSLGGRGTKVHLLFVGQYVQVAGGRLFYDRIHDEGVLSTDFDMKHHLGIARLDTCAPLFSFTWNVEFLENCEWEARLEGAALKHPGEDRQAMHRRVVEAYCADAKRDFEEARVRGEPGLRDEDDFYRRLANRREEMLAGYEP